MAAGVAPRRPEMMFGSGHDLRLSGRMIWCRKCGRFGEERINKKGLGGDCHGEEVRNQTQWDRLQTGRHPRKKDVFLPPDVAFTR